MNTMLQDALAAGPLTIVVLLAIVLVVIASVLRRGETITWWVALIGLTTAFAVALDGTGRPGTAFSGMLSTGGYADFCAAVFAAAGILSVLLSRAYIAREGASSGEYYALLVIALSGMILMAGAADMIVFFLGLEIMSIPFYVLAAFSRKRVASNEAGLKYFLLGSFASGFLLYGIALVYGSSGSTQIAVVASKAGALADVPLFLIGLAMVMIGLAFKVAAVPFHMWVPDVYEGSPTTVSGFMSTGGKAAAFSSLLLIFAPKVLEVTGPVREMLAVIAALSMVVGNILAIVQTSAKRMLAYSSIAHAGYILTGVVAANPFGQTGVLFYLMAYTLMNIGAFGVLAVIETDRAGNVAVADHAGLGTRKPALAALMALFMFSLAGIPPFAGFFAKYYVFAGAIKAGYTWLAILGVLMSAVSAYYYLRIVVMMYFKEQASENEVSVPAAGMLALAVAAVGLVQLGLFPSTLLWFTQRFLGF